MDLKNENHISIWCICSRPLLTANAIPEKGQTILGSQHIVGPGGKGSNQAIAAAKLNGKVNFITKIGNDKNGEMALNLYKSLGMDVASIIHE